MQEQLQMVRDFHTAFGYKQDLEELTEQMYWARPSYIAEEFGEYLAACAKKDKVAQLDALCDLAYFALGTVGILGGKLDESVFIGTLADSVLNHLHLHMKYNGPEHNTDVIVSASAVITMCRQTAQKLLNADFLGAFAEVQRSNMSKLDKDGKPIYNEAGKICKSELFSEPQLGQFFR